MFSKTTLFAALVSAVVNVAARPQDVWDPTITSPAAGDVWAAGSTHNVTWYGLHAIYNVYLTLTYFVLRDTSNAPAQFSEGSEVVLAKGGVLDNGQYSSSVSPRYAIS